MKTTQRIRWSTEEWKNIITHAAETLRPKSVTTQTNLAKFLSVGQEILPTARRKKVLKYLPDLLEDFATTIGVNVKKTKVFIDPLAEEPDPATPATTKRGRGGMRGTLTDIYFALRDINDSLELLTEVGMLSAGRRPSDLPEVPRKRVEASIKAKADHRSKPRILIVGLLDHQNAEIRSRWDSQAKVMNGWHPEKTAHGCLPLCEHVIVATKFVSHSKCHKAHRPEADFHYVSGGITSIDRKMAEILKVKVEGQP